MDLVPTTVVLDLQHRALRYDYRAIDLISSQPASVRANRSPLELWAAANGYDTKAMAILLWAGLRHSDKTLTLDGTQKMLRSALTQERTTIKELNDALNAAMNQSGVLGIFNALFNNGAGGDVEDVDADPEDPTPATVMTVRSAPIRAENAGDAEQPAG